MLSGAPLNGATRIPFEIFTLFFIFSSLMRSLNLYFFNQVGLLTRLLHLTHECTECGGKNLLLNVAIYQQTRRQTPQRLNLLFMRTLRGDTV